MNDLLNFILAQDAFRKKTNPDGYTVNVSAWEQALLKAARNGYIPASHGSSGEPSISTSSQAIKPKKDHLVLRADESLLRALELPEWGRPIALAAVFDEAIRSRIMVPLQMYRASSSSLNKPQWSLIEPGVLNPWSVMSWGLKQLKGVVVGLDRESTPPLQAQELVLVENLKEAAGLIVKQAMSRNSSKTDLIYSKENFVQEFASVFTEENDLSHTDFNVLLMYLSRDSGAIAYDGKTIKFRSSNDAPKEITEQDTAICSIKSAMSAMTKQVENLENKIIELNLTAKATLHNKNKISALAAVRSKKLAEHNLKQRLNTLAQLEEVYSKIEQATSHVEFVQVMETSTGVLRGLNTQIGDSTKIEDIVDELREEISKVDEVGNILNEAGPQIDEAEIDDELQEMENKEQHDQEEEETRRRLAELHDLKQRAKEPRTASNQGVDSALEESIGRLSRMSVEEGREATAQ
ncbi:hypothetical protein EYZ11_000563 [Aspergillus tanneri]|uniref:SNF7 family protein n=1 Tax=Aspergillus tanneri TaxID=1220188 RepID=A0A4S3JWV9_9EURO|nr:hypothetical protein EYZ11_000563 [Aspergillus tanneri]